jgi:hypothetical protein
MRQSAFSTHVLLGEVPAQLVLFRKRRERLLPADEPDRSQSPCLTVQQVRPDRGWPHENSERLPNVPGAMSRVRHTSIILPPSGVFSERRT